MDAGSAELPLVDALKNEFGIGQWTQEKNGEVMLAIGRNRTEFRDEGSPSLSPYDRLVDYLREHNENHPNDKIAFTVHPVGDLPHTPGTLSFPKASAERILANVRARELTVYAILSESPRETLARITGGAWQAHHGGKDGAIDYYHADFNLERGLEISKQLGDN
ncbi:MAG: hypothetical protein ACK52W_07665 [Alphaproteobacteria bacterium]